jgi:hypothetical protein
MSAKFTNLTSSFNKIAQPAPLNVKLTHAQRGMMSAISKKGFACPDMIIFAGRCGFNGMLLELKKESPFKKDGYLKTIKHLHNQNQAHRDLTNQSFYARFVWSFDMAKDLLDWYFEVK